MRTLQHRLFVTALLLVSWNQCTFHNTARHRSASSSIMVWAQQQDQQQQDQGGDQQTDNNANTDGDGGEAPAATAGNEDPQRTDVQTAQQDAVDVTDDSEASVAPSDAVKETGEATVATTTEAPSGGGSEEEVVVNGEEDAANSTGTEEAETAPPGEDAAATEAPPDVALTEEEKEAQFFDTFNGTAIETPEGAIEDAQLVGTLTPTEAMGTGPPIKCDDDNVDFEYYKTRTIRDIILDRPNLEKFRDSLIAVGIFENELNDVAQNWTVIAVRDHAIEANRNWLGYLRNPKNWVMNLRHTVYNHMIEKQSLSAAEMLDGVHYSMEDPLYGDAKRERLDNIEILCSIQAKNGYVHIVDEIIRPKFFDHDLSDMELMSEFGPDRDSEQRVSLVDVVDFLDARDAYKARYNEGMTNIGCRIRAFNRINDYHKWTINNAKDKSVKWGELLNASFVNESYKYFIEYNIIENKVYNSDDIETGYEELRMASNWCAHMWITKHQDQICFNNACLVISPPAFSKVGTPAEKRIQIASNGIAYVVDKCLVCPGIAMLAEYAAEYTVHEMKDVSQFLTSSEWNRRNLSLDVGDGGPITMFSAVSTGWDALTGEDITRLSTDMWKPHQWDFLRHMMIQGNYTEKELRQWVESEGVDGLALNITSLANQTLTLEIDTARDKLLVNGGDLYFPDIHGVDGMMHFITKVPLVRSVTHSVYDIGYWLGDQYEQLNLIDGVFLDSDMRRLEPLTGLYAPDADWRNKIIEVADIERVLENHLFDGLMWCWRLLEMAEKKETIESQNGAYWSISVNDFGMPCFDTISDFGEEQAKSCVTECDILARNGIVHVVDTVLLTEAVETRGPLPPLPPGARPPNMRPDGTLNVPGGGKTWFEKDDKPIDYSRPKREYDYDEVDDIDESKMLPGTPPETEGSAAGSMHGFVQKSVATLLVIVTAFSFLLQ